MLRAEVSASAKAWDAGGLRAEDFGFRFGRAAEAELRALLGPIEQFDPEVLDAPAPGLPTVCAELEALRRQVERSCGFALIEPVAGLEDPEQCRALSWMIGRMLGAPLAQNDADDRLVSVYDRDRSKRMRDGARYHQTREGGSLHTDNVNLPDRWDYLVMTCVAPAMTGGESLLVSGLAVYDLLERAAPRALETLCADFWWESRGISEAVFRAPIVTFNGWGEPEFRYLRPYLVSAHEKAGEPLTEVQLWALDTLDSLLESAQLQFRRKLAAGETLVVNDNQIFHGRTCFSDHFDGTIYRPELRAAGKRFNRFFDRVWIKR